MTIQTQGRRPKVVWSSPAERIIVVCMLVIVQLAVVFGVVILGSNHDLDKASITAILGTVAGGSGTAIVHKLGSRS